MIIDLFISFTFSVVSFFISLFPTADTSRLTEIDTYVSDFHDIFDGVSYFLPVNAILFVLSTIFVIEFTIITFKSVRFVLSHLPFGIFQK